MGKVRKVERVKWVKQWEQSENWSAKGAVLYQTGVKPRGPGPPNHFGAEGANYEAD
jgi:hypothetical protein